jgi:hypothetical protein
MTIRVTHIYGRINGERYLVHRHADFPPSDRSGPPDQGALDFRCAANSGTYVEGPTQAKRKPA